MTHPLQAMFDGMSAEWMRERAQSQMTLGGLIAALEKLPGDTSLQGIGEPHSYRGYYSDLAFETVPRTTAAELLAVCHGCMGQVFEGYKGGDFVMGALTPVWLSSYGCCGVKVISLDPATGEFTTQEDE